MVPFDKPKKERKVLYYPPPLNLDAYCLKKRKGDKYKGFRYLKVWQIGMELFEEVVKDVEQFPKTEVTGILEKGKRGIDSPVVIIGKNDLYTSPFDAFKNTFDRMWINAKKIDEV